MGCISQRGGWASAISIAVMPKLHKSLLGEEINIVEYFLKITTIMNSIHFYVYTGLEKNISLSSIAI